MGLRRLTLTRWSGEGQHRIAGHFRSRSRRGGYGDIRCRRLRKGLSLADNFQVIQQVAAVGEKRGNGFAGIDHTAAANPDHRFASCFTGLLYARANRIQGRFAAHRESKSEHLQRLKMV